MFLKCSISNVHTPDFESQLLQNEPCNRVFKSTKFSKKGVFVSTTSGPASLFNSPETLQSPSLSPCQQPKPYTQQLEETIISKYSAVKEVFNNLSGDETESSDSRPASPLSPALITALTVRTAPTRPVVPALMQES